MTENILPVVPNNAIYCLFVCDNDDSFNIETNSKFPLETQKKIDDILVNNVIKFFLSDDNFK